MKNTIMTIFAVLLMLSLFTFNYAFAVDRDIRNDRAVSTYSGVEFDRDLSYENSDYSLK